MTRRTMLNAGILAGLLTVLVVVMWPAPAPPTTNAERTVAIAGQLRCPYCNGESIADAPSAIARDLQEFIEEEVAAGKTDEEIIDFFVSTYGEQVALDPPLLGWGLWLWLLPLLGLAGGAVLITQRLRRGGTPASTDAGVISEQLAAAQRDLDDIEVQVAVGDIAPDDAAMLRASYESEVDLLERTTPDGDEPVDRKRKLVGGLVLVVGAVALTFGVMAAADDRAPNDLITGGVPGVSLDDVSNEELELVITENPDIVGMRLALAGRYFEEGEFSDALRHYLYILERRDDAEALANVGWMTFLSGDAGTGLRFVERSLEVDPDHLQSYWFLANIRFFALDDASGAIPALEKLLAAEGIPDDIREEAQALLDQVKAEV